jgi:peptidoglycan/LPS O-acetylase OafA/YrhL
MTYFVMKMGLMYNLQAAEIVHREDWLGRFLTFTPDLYYVFQYSFAGVYNWVYVDCNIYCYNNFLWSIGVEYVGSVFVLGIAPLLAFIRKPIFFAVIYMIVGFLLTSYCGVFAVGIICALMRENGTFQKYRKNIFVALLSFVLFGLLVASDWYRQNYPNLTAANGEILFAADKFWRTYFFEITSSLTVITIYFNKYFVFLLKTRFSQFLGFISFPIFLIQFGMLSSFESFLIVFLREHINLFSIQLAIGFTTLAFSVFIAYYFAHIEGFILRKINQRLRYFTQ